MVCFRICTYIYKFRKVKEWSRPREIVSDIFFEWFIACWLGCSFVICAAVVVVVLIAVGTQLTRPRNHYSIQLLLKPKKNRLKSFFFVLNRAR